MAGIWQYWGKARPHDASPARYHLLPYHCLDVAAVGVAYLRAQPHLRRWFMQSLGLQEEQALFAWFTFWLALHDLGKFAESFQGQRGDVFAELRRRAPDPGKPYDIRHDTLGLAAWRAVLADRAVAEAWLGADTDGDTLDGLNAWVRSVTGHHGQPPREDAYFSRHFSADDRASILEFTTSVRALACGSAITLMPTPADPDAFRRASEHLSWWVAGLTVLADWIGSNTDFFPYRDQPPAWG
jgi:CRISPR-associated endonuclease/helicase Cas3